MPAPRRFELDELMNRPGTYFNPQTDVLVVVDDSTAIEAEVLDDGEDYGDADWVLISDESPIDEHRRDELLESFQARHHPGTLDHDEDDEPEVDELEPDPDEDYE